MNYGFLWTEKSHPRNVLTEKYEPIQPIILIESSTRMGADTFFDIGANIGFYSVVMTLLPSIKKVYSFEACDTTFRELARNIELNSLKDIIHAENKAVSNEKGYVDLLIESELSGINSVVDTTFHDIKLFNNIKSVESISIDDYITANGRKFSFKIDVEGHEKQVIQGARKTMEQNECVVQVEVYRDSGAEELLNLYGYKRFFRAKNDVYYTNSESILKTNITAILEASVEKFINLSLGTWPVKDDLGELQASCYLDNNKVIADCNANSSRLSGEIEFAYYVYSEKEKIFTQWYSDIPSLVFDLPEEYRNTVISITAFAREKKDPKRKILARLNTAKD